MLREIKTLLLPTKSELFLWGGVGLLLLVLQNYYRFWAYFSGVPFEDVKNRSDVGVSVEAWLAGLEAGLDPRLADFLVWMLVGVVAISVILFLQSLFRNAGDERNLIEHMRNPNSRLHELELYLLRIAVRVAALLALLVYLRAFLSIINPALTKLFFIASLSLDDPISWLWLPLSIVAMGLGLYVFAILTRIVLLKARIFG